MGLTSSWDMIAGKVVDNPENPLVKIMNIEASLFKRYVDEYPDFRRFLILRSTVRRAYFNYQMKLSSFNCYLQEKQEEIEKDFKNDVEFPGCEDDSQD